MILGETSRKQSTFMKVLQQLFGPPGQWIARFFYQKTMWVLAAMFCAAVALVLWHFSRLSNQLIQASALQSAPEYQQALAEVRALYTSEVANRVRGHGVVVAHDYKQRAKPSIPIPTSFTLLLGERLSAKSHGVKVRLYSAHPFPWRRKTGGARDDFERDALQYLASNPKKYFARFENYQGKPAMRYATADVMQKACVSCHNSHPASPRRGWKVGDVRGVLEVVRPLDQVTAHTNRGLRGTSALLGGLSVLGLAALGLVFGKLRRDSSQLELRVEERTHELAQVNHRLQAEVRQREQAQALLIEAKEDAESSRRAAEGANQAKSQFLANMSHELRTPLNAIIGYSEMLQEEAEDEGATAYIDDLKKINGAGKHLLDMINGVLDLSKIEAGKMELYLETFDVATMLANVTSTIEPLIAKNGNQLQVIAAPDLGSMQADLTKVRQSLFNLLSNAAKFTRNGTITLRAERDSSGQTMRFAVSDTGIGMTPEQMQRLFQAFSQADGSTTRNFGGTGLGLVITRHFCEMMGGSIDVESTSDEGTTFSLTLPVQVEEAPQIVATPAPLEPRAEVLDAVSASKPLILAIDDDAEMHDLLRRYLRDENFQLVTATNGEEGLEMARRLKPAAVTLDVMMPGVDGWAVLAELKSDPQTRDIPVIMLTMMDGKAMGYTLGASEVLTKPINRERLVEVLHKYRQEETIAPVLVVEDDANARHLLRQMLERDGWGVCEASNGREALERLQRSVPRLILLDLMMPEMDGFEFLAELRRQECWRDIPVAVITARDINESERRQLEGAVQQILQKGAYDHRQLLREVRDLLQMPLSKD